MLPDCIHINPTRAPRPIKQNAIIRPENTDSRRKEPVEALVRQARITVYSCHVRDGAGAGFNGELMKSMDCLDRQR